MRTKFFTLALFLLAITSVSFATGNNPVITSKVLTSFSSTFSTSSEITWSKTADYVKASFKMDGQFLFAFYTTTGELLGVSRNISSKQLPLRLQSLIREEYCGTWITELFEFSTKEQTVYMATVENADEKLTIKSTSGHAWELVSRARKP